jgi:scyllo-inosamine-4-phosphate amidinotransferase 1
MLWGMDLTRHGAGQSRSRSRRGRYNLHGWCRRSSTLSCSAKATCPHLRVVQRQLFRERCTQSVCSGRSRASRSFDHRRPAGILEIIAVASLHVSIVSVHNEWDPLEEVIVGSALGARIPSRDLSLHAIEYRGEPRDSIESGPFPPSVIAETEAVLDELGEVLASFGVKVHRPQRTDPAGIISTPDWSTTGFYNYCPRDILLTVGDTVIEAPMPLRSRSRECLAYTRLRVACIESGTTWIAAPPPRLLDEMYDLDNCEQLALTNREPVFDAANLLRIGRDIVYLVSAGANELGATWLQAVLGDAYRVHCCHNLYHETHIDTTIMPLRPGLVLLNRKRVRQNNMPTVFRDWEHLWCPELVDIGSTGRPISSTSIGMNLLMVNPELAIVERDQPALISALESKGIEVHPMHMPHARTMGGAFHCVTLDLRRRGELESY